MNRKSAFSTAIVLALGLAAGTAMAQSPSANLMGEAKPGSVAVVENVDTGFTREVKVNDNGRYQLRRLPTGTFRVTIRHPDGSTEQPKTVTLRVGTTSRVQ